MIAYIAPLLAACADLDKSADIQDIVADVQKNRDMVLGLATLSCSNDYVKE